MHSRIVIVSQTAHNLPLQCNSTLFSPRFSAFSIYSAYILRTLSELLLLLDDAGAANLMKEGTVGARARSPYSESWRLYSSARDAAPSLLLLLLLGNAVTASDGRRVGCRRPVVVSLLLLLLLLALMLLS